MRASTLEILRCPACGSSLEIAGRGVSTVSGRLRDGLLGCSGCGQAYPVCGLVPRLVRPADMSDEERSKLADLSRDPDKAPEIVPDPSFSPDELRQMVRERVRAKILHEDLTPKLRERAEKDVSYRVCHTEEREKFVKTVLSYMGEVPRRVLDVGGGQGGILASFRRRFEVHLSLLLDLDPEWVELASLRDPETEVVRGDATSLPLADRSFDLMFTAATLEHIGGWREAVGEMCRVSRAGLLCYNPNGRFPYDMGHLDAPFVTWLPPGPAARVAYLFHRLRRTGRSMESIRRELAVTFYIPRSAVVRELRSHGLEVTNAFGVFLDHSVDDQYHLHGRRLMRLLRGRPRLRRFLAKAFVWTGLEPNVYLFYTRSPAAL